MNGGGRGTWGGGGGGHQGGGGGRGGGGRTGGSGYRFGRGGRRGGGRGHSGRGGPGVNQAGQGAPFQCKHTLDGTCSWGPSRCRYVHGVDFHANGVDLEAHKGAIRGLASDANCLYTFGEDGIIKTYSWTPGTGITGCKEQNGGGPGSFFTTSDPTHAFYFYGFRQPLVPGLSSETSLVGRAQMFFNNASTDLTVSDDCPYTDPRKVLACVAWEMPAPSPPHIFTAGEDGRIYSWSYNAEQARFVVGATYVGHTRPVTALILAATENPPLLYSAGLDGTIRCWNCASHALEWTSTAVGVFRRLSEPPQPHEGHVEGITDMCSLVCEGQSFLATSSQDGSVRIWSIQGGNLGVTLPLDFPTGAAVKLCQVAAGGEGGGSDPAGLGPPSFLVVAYESGHMVFWTLPGLETYLVIDPPYAGKPGGR
ncbi:zinc finger ccch domain-containing protein 63, partial [Nannochloropsis gaditana CCMP526]|uniref:zinc finger ccch domain-containing protein 63 n=1 Tax=Nannochloropsis gaditana (strain CCMP526) TaxID=1093141 RepID=UPI00029F56FE